MLHDRYTGQVCSIARSLELVGERWTLLILRDLFLGHRRFEALQSRLGIARNVLAARLEKLVAAGIVERRRYSERPLRHEYRLTAKGRDLWPVLVALMQWGDRHAAPAGPPVLLAHDGSAASPTRIACATGAASRSSWSTSAPSPGRAPRPPPGCRHRPSSEHARQVF